MNSTATRKMRHYDTIVAGLGETGWSCVRFLQSQGKCIAVMDSREQPPYLAAVRRRYPEVEVIAGSWDYDFFTCTEQVVVSPGLQLDRKQCVTLQAQGISFISDIELFFRHVEWPVIAVTGTNGKSTVVSLLADMAKHAQLAWHVGGNIGTPALDLLLLPTVAGYVLELSSFQLEFTYSLHTDAAVVLNISSDHLDRHGSMAAYAAIKNKIYEYSNIQLVNLDEPLFSSQVRDVSTQVTYSLDPQKDADWQLTLLQDEFWLSYRQCPLMPRSALWSQMDCNVSNALACMALAKVMGIPEEIVCRSLQEFPGLPHRCQHVATTGGIHWFDDSKATNTGACLAAVHSLYQPQKMLILLVGGDAKGQDFSDFAEQLSGRVDHLVLFGKDAEYIAAQVAQKIPCHYSADLKQAVNIAYELLPEGGQVLLSPACSSLDSFTGYEQRGECFVQEVATLSQRIKK